MHPRLNNLDHPSRFWSELGRDSFQSLESQGFGNFKRGCNRHFFDWRFAWTTLPCYPASFLFWLWRNTTWREKARAFSLNTQTMIVRLLWQYAVRHDWMGVTYLPEPALGNPRDIWLGGRLISQDLANASLEVNYLAAHSPAPERILEIGGGYGRTAYALLSFYPDAEYVNVDVMPARAVSRIYLGGLFPDRNIRCICPSSLVDLPDGWATHGISISTFPEYTLEQVRFYREQLDRVVKGYIYLKQWKSWTNRADGTAWEFDEFAPAHWTRIAAQSCPYATKFREAVYRNH